MLKYPRTILLTLIGLLLAGCGDDGAEETSTESAPAEAKNPIAAALDAPGRSESDKDRDSQRKPAEILSFYDIAPGQTVFEFYAGGGWYSGILAPLLGEDGALVMHNRPRFSQYFRENIHERSLLTRHHNIEYREIAPQALQLEPGRYDRAVMILTYHDLLFPPEEGAETPDRVAILKAIYEGLKPGGVLGIIDHIAPSDVPPREAGEDLHRIDPALVRREAEAAGFVFDGESDALSNPGDPHDTPIFDVEQGTTDRFVHRYVKPEDAAAQ